MKRRITIPATKTVTVATVQGDVVEEFSFVDFIIKTLLQDRRFSTDRAAMRIGDDVEDAFKDKKPGDVVDLGDAAWTVLSKVADKPQLGQRGDLGYSAAIRQVSEYIDVICDAQPAPAPAKE